MQNRYTARNKDIWIHEIPDNRADYNKVRLSRKLILFAPSRRFASLCFARVAQNFIVARQYALARFCEQLGVPSLSECQESHFMAEFPGFYFHPLQQDAFENLVDILSTNTNRFDAVTLMQNAADIRNRAYKTITAHTYLSKEEEIFFDTLATFQDVYNEENCADILIKYLMPQLPRQDKRSKPHIWETAFGCLFSGGCPDIRADTLEGYAFTGTPETMSRPLVNVLMANRLRERSSISRPLDALFVSDDEALVNRAHEAGYFVYLLQRSGFDSAGLLDYIREFLYLSRNVFGGKRGGKGKGKCSDFIYIAPSI